MKTILATFLFFSQICSAADNPKIDQCLQKAAGVSSDSGIEDRMRLSCLQENKTHITLNDCQQLKAQIVDSQGAAVVADVCFQELKSRVSVNECFEVAAWSSNSEIRDSHSLKCLRENSSAIGAVQCFGYAHHVFSASGSRDLASNICAEGLSPSPIASGIDTSFSIDE